jgi:transcriptional regulator with XRE-family HTH domain
MKARQEKGISQKQISSMLNVPQSTYAGYESGTRKVPLSIIIKLAKILKTSPDLLIGDNEISSNSLVVHGLEKDLVISYRNADEVDKTIVRRTLKLDIKKENQKNA